MAIREKKVTASVMVCDFCHKDIPKDQGTQIEGAAEGYMKRDHLRFDLCEECASQAGLKRRGRRPAAQTAPAATQAAPAATKRPRGRPRKNPAPVEDDWEMPVAASS